MTPEIQDKLVKLLGLLVQVLVIVGSVKLLPNNPEVVAMVSSLFGTVYGAISYNTPIKAVQAARGLVSLHAPNSEDVDKMRDAVKAADSINPPGGQ